MGSVQDIILLFCVRWESRELGGRELPPVSGKREKGQCDLVCVEHLAVIGLMVAVMLMSY